MYVEVKNIISDRDKQFDYIIDMIKQLLADGKIQTTDELTKTFYSMRYHHRIEESYNYKYEEPKQISSKPESQNILQWTVKQYQLGVVGVNNEAKDKRVEAIKLDAEDFYKYVRALANLWMIYSHTTLNAINTSQKYRLLYVKTFKEIRDDLNYYNMAYEKDLNLFKMIFSPIILPGLEEKKDGNIRRLKKIAQCSIYR